MKPPEPGKPLRLALDQNFPLDLLSALQGWLPQDVRLEHVATIDPRLSDLDDDELLIVLRQWGYDGLVTNNYRMLEVPHELAAIIATKSVVVATVETGHDPIRAAGALLLELPGLHNRILSNQASVFWLRYARRPAAPGWDYMTKIAAKQGVESSELWERHRPDVSAQLLERSV